LREKIGYSWYNPNAVANKVSSFDTYTCDPVVPETSRGRSRERVDRTLHHRQAPFASRASSASSVRSMIDERLEWAQQDRMRSASRNQSPPESPFHQHSPFYADFAKVSGPKYLPYSVYTCECCPADPQSFNTRESLEYVLPIPVTSPFLAD
jgi:hypothetical protein